jgi:predicted DNA-binding transcriptional regulator YafY
VARRNLSTGRLRRLLDISALVRRNPRLKMAEVLSRLGISRSQFYRDREELQRLGLRFGRRPRGFTLGRDLLLPPVEMAVSELLALCGAVSALARKGEAEAAYLALRSLLSLLARLPGPVRALLEPYAAEAVLGEGFGCPLPVLEVLMQAISEGRRIVIQTSAAREGAPESPPGSLSESLSMTIDPQGIVLREGDLHLQGLWVEGGRPASVPLAEILAAGFTPFLAPEPPLEET